MAEEHPDPNEVESDEHTGDGDDGHSIPPDAVDEAERLTRLARDALDDGEADAYREERSRHLSEHGYTARVREEDRAVLVLHPEEWVEDGTVYPSRIDDLDRGIERPLEGPGAAEQWETVAEHNRALAESVADDYREAHVANARALADFASNHYAKPVEALTRAEVEEFLLEYFPRNAFPSDDQKAVVEESVQLVFDAAGEQSPYRH